MSTAIRVSTALVGLAAAAMLAACGTDTPQAKAPTVTSTVTQSPTTSASPTLPGTEPPSTDVVDTDGSASGGGAAPQPQTPPEPCGPGNPSSAELDSAIAKVRTDGPGYKWVTGAANFSTCNNISYMELDTRMGTVSSPAQLMIFDRNLRFIGTGIRCNAAYQTVVGATADRITVRYGYIVGDEALAAPSGTAQVTFRWNGSRVVMDGTLPFGVTHGKC